MWTKAAVGTFQRALATAAKWEGMIAKLETVAQYSPAFAERVRQLRAMRDNIHAVASAALAIDPEGE